jgi:hypothetical protein
MSSPNTEPIFGKVPFLGVATLTTEVLGRNGGVSGGKELVTAGTWGAVIEGLAVIPVADSGSIAAVLIRVFWKAATSDVLNFIMEVPCPAIASVTALEALSEIQITLPEAIVGDVGTRALRIGAGDSLYVALGTALAGGAYNVRCQGLFY